MHYTEEEIAELNVLIFYSLNTINQGIKIHSTADPEKITAVQRLFDKGLVTQKDGGYLTDLGRTAAEHAQALILMLAPHENGIEMLSQTATRNHESSFSTME
ncbi:MAG: TIGR02647 family protein [Thermotogales bacterium]|nr:TIGR02647 family protein [Thermotogales bacterium]